MAKSLVIVESPAKAKTINKILGRDFVVRASMGHVRDLPEKKLGVNVDQNFEPEYVPIKGRQKVIAELLKEAKTAETIYLAPDPDREGEAIAWHLMHLLIDKKIPADRFFRVTYNEITAPAIRHAFSNPGRIDQHRVDSQQARRILDRIVGYQVSPLLWRRIRGSKSAGRVQSVALRLVCERENEILKFKPDEFWVFGANVKKQVDPRDPFAIRLARVGGEKAELKNEAQVQALRGELEGRSLVVQGITERELTRKAQPPYITSTLQQAGSRFFGFSPARSMSLAQHLYEGVDFGDGPSGLITYMRTDSVSVSKEAQGAAREYVSRTYGAEYVPDKPNTYKSRGGAQEAHEAIRPTDVTRRPEDLRSVLKPDEWKLYRMIWERFVASQMAPARIAQQSVDIEAVAAEAGRPEVLFRVSTSQVTFPGYMKVTGQEKKSGTNGDSENGDEADNVPPLAKGERLDLIDWQQEQKFTQPPPRYTEASLVRAMEENGVGRPSTYAQILSTLQAREYVEKEKRALKPTELGEKVNEFLVGNLNNLFDVQFTANMEEALDEIERGHVEWRSMLGNFYGSFAQWVADSKEPPAEKDLVQDLIATLKEVREWAPESKRGKKTYSDMAFVASVQEQFEKGDKAVSMRQVEALVKMLGRYKDQIGDVHALVERAGLQALYRSAAAPKEPPRETTHQKLELLDAVKFDEPRKVGAKVYDDQKFCHSLRDQVVSGRRLSENQLRYLDRLVVKYSEQIPEFEKRSETLGLTAEEQEADHESGPIIELMDQIKEWAPAVQRGKREWDDRKFFDSLKQQFGARKSLSPRQRASLKKMCGRYHAQIPNYTEAAQRLGLPEPKAKGAPRKPGKKGAEA